jgi:hypothetical protein
MFKNMNSRYVSQFYFNSKLELGLLYIYIYIYIYIMSIGFDVDSFMHLTIFVKQIMLGTILDK